MDSLQFHYQWHPLEDLDGAIISSDASTQTPASIRVRVKYWGTDAADRTGKTSAIQGNIALGTPSSCALHLC